MRRFLLTIAAICFAAPSAPAADKPKPERDTPPKIEREERRIEGWTINFDKRLATDEHREIGTRAERLLRDRLYEIAQILPSDRVEQLRKVAILVDLDHGRLTSMQYHPGAGWLREHGYDPTMAKCVHVPSAKRMIDLHHQRVQPWCVLHELAHAYHDQVLGFDDGEIRAAYEAAKTSGSYDEVRFIEGNTTKHYALTTPMEYFAELSEAFIGTNDFFPFVRGELKHHDPKAYALLEKIWGKLP